MCFVEFHWYECHFADELVLCMDWGRLFMEIQNTALYAPMRIVGIQAAYELANVHTTLADLWQQWDSHKASRLPSFTLTVYCVYQYNDETPNRVLITLGRLVAQDLPLPAFAQETLLPAQDYRRYDVPESTVEAVFKTWQLIENDDALPRSFTTDFETYSVHTLPRIYVGIQAA